MASHRIVFTPEARDQLDSLHAHITTAADGRGPSPFALVADGPFPYFDRHDTAYPRRADTDAVVTSTYVDDRAEPKAKASLLDFLRSQGSLTRASVVTTELIIDRRAVRADMVLSDGRDLYFYEIKTASDTLIRLDKQLEAYARHCDFTTVVAATKHINAVISRVPAYVGIYEMLTFSVGEVRVVREPQRSPALSMDAMLSLLPVTEMQARLALAGKMRRSEVITKTAHLSSDLKKMAVISFLWERFEANTHALLDAARRRKIQVKDLSFLRKWRKPEAECTNCIAAGTSSSTETICPDQELYRYIGHSFGPVPEEVQALMVC